VRKSNGRDNKGEEDKERKEEKKGKYVEVRERFLDVRISHDYRSAPLQT
jgi:hypothetical protein